MTTRSRINKLEQLAKPLLDERKKEKAEVEWKKDIFHSMNETIKEHYPKHGWNKLPPKKKWEIYIRPSTIKKYFRPNCPIPLLIDEKKDIYSDLVYDALRLSGDMIFKKIQQRKKEKYLKNDDEYKKMRGL